MADARSLERLPPELRSRVRAAAGHTATVEVAPEGDGYRIWAVSGDTGVEMYLEMRPDGSVEERTEWRPRPPTDDPDRRVAPHPPELVLEHLSDDELVDRVRTALGDVVMLGRTDPVGRQEAWQRVADGVRDLERRYPPEPA